VEPGGGKREVSRRASVRSRQALSWRNEAAPCTRRQRQCVLPTSQQVLASACACVWTGLQVLPADVPREVRKALVPSEYDAPVAFYVGVIDVLQRWTLAKVWGGMQG
jgi:hypothetical protein